MPLHGARRSSLRPVIRRSLARLAEQPNRRASRLGLFRPKGDARRSRTARLRPRCAPRSSPTCTWAAPTARTWGATRRSAASCSEEIARRRPARPARRRARAARAADGARAGDRPALLRGAGRGDGRAPRRPRARQPRPPPRRAAAGRGGAGRWHARARAPRPARRRAGDADRRLARRRRARHRLPGRLAARRRLRHPRPLHGLPHEPAAAGVRRGGSGHARRGTAAGPGRPRATTSAILRPIYGLAYALAETGLAPGATVPSERAWRAISGRSRNGGRARQAAAKAAVSRRRPDQRLAPQPPLPRRLRRRPLPRLDRPQRHRRRDRDVAATAGRGGPHDHRPHPPRRPRRGRRRVAAARRRPAPQHRQLGLRGRLPPPRRPTGALLAGNRHLGRGRGPAAPRAPAARAPARGAAGGGRRRTAANQQPATATRR